MTPYEALKRMRQQTECGIPFSFEFISFNSTKQVSNGIKRVDKALLRLGLRDDQSDKAQVLIAYTNHNEHTDRFFNLPLLTKFNGIDIQP